MEMRYEKQGSDSLEHQQKELYRFVNFYSAVKPRGSLDGNTPFEVLQASFLTCGMNNAVIFYIIAFITIRINNAIRLYLLTDNRR